MLRILFSRTLLIIMMLLPICAIADNDKAQIESLKSKFSKLEVEANGRLGVSAIDMENGTKIEYNSTDLFPFCSTFKVMGVAAILKQSMTESDLLSTRLEYNSDYIESAGYSPVTSKHIKDGMTISELCGAAITQSDNGAINLIIDQLNGTKSINKFAKSIGDKKFNLVRMEPSLNSAIPGDKKDTTTPDAMQKSLQQLVLSDVLDDDQRELLQNWLINNKTGGKRIRAGVPKGWKVGDKTGTGDYGTTNDIAVIWPPKCAPIILTVYFTQNQKDADPRDDVVAEATRIVMNEIQRTNKCINPTD